MGKCNGDRGHCENEAAKDCSWNMCGDCCTNRYCERHGGTPLSENECPRCGEDLGEFTLEQHYDYYENACSHASVDYWSGRCRCCDEQVNSPVDPYQGQYDDEDDEY